MNATEVTSSTHRKVTCGRHYCLKYSLSKDYLFTNVFYYLIFYKTDPCDFVCKNMLAVVLLDIATVVRMGKFILSTWINKIS